MKHKSQKHIYAPQYYADFHCIADRCRHSCCIDWEICIDEETYQRYQQTEDIRKTITLCEDGPCMTLDSKGRCPHLNDRGLCNIILTHGEAYLSEICRNHPRFYNDICTDRIEAGLGIVCEEACRLILENEQPFALSEMEVLDGDEAGEEIPVFDALSSRNRMIAIIESAESFDEVCNVLHHEFAIPTPYTPDEWLDRYLALEILDANWQKDLQAMRGRLSRKPCPDSNPYGIFYARLLTYFVYRHVGVAESAEDIRSRLAFCILSVEVIRRLFEADGEPGLEGLIDWARRYSAEIEYSEDNTEELILAFACAL